MSQLQKEFEELQDLGKLCTTLQKHPEVSDRYAVIEITLQALAQMPGLTLGALMAHPDVPTDAKPLCSLAVTSPSIRFVIASKDFDKVPEGMIPPTLHLAWQRDGDEVKPMATGARPTYVEAMTCPHCDHHWPGLD